LQPNVAIVSSGFLPAADLARHADVAQDAALPVADSGDVEEAARVVMTCGLAQGVADDAHAVRSESTGDVYSMCWIPTARHSTSHDGQAYQCEITSRPPRASDAAAAIT
jgi:hypothetical protein